MSKGGVSMDKRPTDILEEEHRVIEKIVKVMTALIKKLENNEDVDASDIQSIAEFMRGFGDKCHHGKEEKELFPLLGKKGVPLQGCPVAALIHEHELGRTLVKGLMEATDKEMVLKQLRGLTNLYPNHIWKEDYLLFPMTNKILSDSEQKDLHAKFERVEEEISLDEHNRYEQLAEELEKKYR